MQFGFGSGLLYAKRTDITNQGPLRFGAFQDLSLDFTGDLKELFGQNQFALDVARGKVKIEGKAKFAQISAPLMNAVFFGGAITSGQVLSVYQEADMVPATSTYTVTVANSSTFVADLGVHYAASGNPLTLVTALTAAGQYMVNSATGVYTFYSGDASAALLIDYTYSATSGWTLGSGNPLMGNTPRFAVSFTQTYGGNTMTITMPQCVTSKYTLPTKQDDYVMEEFDFQAFSGSGSPITISTSSYKRMIEDPTTVVIGGVTYICPVMPFYCLERAWPHIIRMGRMSVAMQGVGAAQALLYKAVSPEAQQEAAQTLLDAQAVAEREEANFVGQTREALHIIVAALSLDASVPSYELLSKALRPTEFAGVLNACTELMQSSGLVQTAEPGEAAATIAGMPGRLNGTESSPN